MSLPKRLILAVLFSSFLLLFFPNFAFAQPQPITPAGGANYQVLSAASSIQGQVLVGNPVDWFFDRAGDLVSMALDVVEKGGNLLMDKVFIKDAAGCSMEDKACQQQQITEIEQGV